jgi:hypothetical protein
MQSGPLGNDNIKRFELTPKGKRYINAIFTITITWKIIGALITSIFKDV